MKALEETALAAGCCKRCSFRFCGRREPEFYHLQDDEKNQLLDDKVQPAIKRHKCEVCVCCLGLLQPEFWSPILAKVRAEISDNNYDCESFAGGLSYPASLILREHSFNLYLKNTISEWNQAAVPLKQAWKWCFGPVLSESMNKALDSGSNCPFLVTIHFDYKDDTNELNRLKTMSPEAFERRMKSHKKFRGELYTRLDVEKLIKKLDEDLFKKHYECPPKLSDVSVECSRIEFVHNPIYLGGRYFKYSRELCQTPWVIEGVKVMETSIQDIIFEPIVKLFRISGNIENELKFISAGREDVDVRCLNTGRPFAVEILNPKITRFTDEQLNDLQNEINSTALLKVKHLQLVLMDSLSLLKKGEEKMSKTYMALCIKLGRDEIEDNHVTDDDINVINTYSNSSDGLIVVKQKTPMRVLHRRPLLVRDKKILSMKADKVDGKPNMFTIELTTDAGTYIKEFVHGDFGRTRPNVSQILGSKVDIIALDVIAVNLEWPPPNQIQ